MTTGMTGGSRSGRARIGMTVVVLALASGTGPVVAGTGPIGPIVPAPAPEVPDLPESATDAGGVTVVSASDRNDEITGGDTNTVFTLRLPTGSVCPGDSANDDWRVQTFIVPAETTLGSLSYGATRPSGEFMYGLYTTEGRPYTQVLLGQNPEPGLPGQILDPPALSFAPFTPDLLPLGRYKIGVACSYFEVGERYWDAELALTEDREIQPGERRWTVASADGADGADAAAASSGDDGGLDPMVVVAAAAAAAAVPVAAVLAYRRRRSPALVKEHAR